MVSRIAAVAVLRTNAGRTGPVIACTPAVADGGSLAISPPSKLKLMPVVTLSILPPPPPPALPPLPPLLLPPIPPSTHPHQQMPERAPFYRRFRKQTRFTFDRGECKHADSATRRRNGVDEIKSDPAIAVRRGTHRVRETPRRTTTRHRDRKPR